MKRIGLISLLIAFCVNVFANDIDNKKLACDTAEISKEVGKLVVLPKQTLECAGILTRASAEIFGTSNLIRFKSYKLAKKGLERSIVSLLQTTGKSCVGNDVILRAQAKLVAIGTQL